MAGFFMLWVTLQCACGALFLSRQNHAGSSLACLRREYFIQEEPENEPVGHIPRLDNSPVLLSLCATPNCPKTWQINSCICKQGLD